jgi:NAD(P)-dependent dehydrogenase (short-subunit alcohol dehydrogenase family)
LSKSRWAERVEPRPPRLPPLAGAWRPGDPSDLASVPTSARHEKPSRKRVVVVTGAGGGIGHALVELFTRSNDHVIALGRNRRSLQRTNAAAVELCDITDEDQVAVTFGRIGPVDVLVNNAGAATSAPLGSTRLEDWRRQMDVNATGAFLCTRAVLGDMLKRNHGRVVAIASTGGLVGGRFIAGYVASKHALVGLMRATAAEVEGTGVTANAVCPTFVRTEMTSQSIERIVRSTGRDRDMAEAAIAHMSPLGRLLEPREVAAAAGFLASGDAAAVNGQTLILDGGGILGRTS